jgi:hypothetical protein
MGKTRNTGKLATQIQFDNSNNLVIGTSASSSFNTSGSVNAIGGITGSIFGIGDPTSFSASISSNLVSIQSVTASNIARLSNLETKSSSVDISVSSINTFTSSNSNTSLNLLTSSLATTGSNSFYGTQVFSGSVYIANDLIVQGSSSIQYISASSVSIGTNIVQLNTATPSVRYAGVSVQDSGSSAGITGSILWDSLCNRWIYSNPSTIGYSGGMLMSGPRTSTLGTELPLTCNYIAKSGGGDHLYDSCIWEMSGSVGIGTITPLDNLHIAASEVGNVGISIQNTNASYSSQLRFLNCAGTEKAAITFVQSTTSLNLNVNQIDALIISSTGVASFSSCVAGNSVMNITNTSPTGQGITLTAGDDYTSYALKVLDYAGVEKLRLDGNGNLLVGYCTDQGYKFGVNGNSIFSGAAIFSSTLQSGNLTVSDVTANTYFYNTFANAANRNWALAFGIGSLGDFNLMVSNAQSGNPISAGTSKFNIQTNGNVGIGTCSPTHNLEIANTGGSVYQKMNADFGIGYFGMETADDSMRFVTAQCTPIQFYTNNTERMSINSVGDIRMDATSGSKLVTVKGATGNGNYGELRLGNADHSAGIRGCHVSSGNVDLEFWTEAYSAGGYQKRMTITSGGQVGINTIDAGIQLSVKSTSTTSSSYPLFLLNSAGTGNMYVRSDSYGYLNANAWNYISDLRMKENISDILEGLSIISELKPKHFDYIDGAKNRIGFIAQDVQEILPNLVTISDEKTGMLALQTDALIPILVKAIQEQQCMICSQSQKIALLESCIGIV